MGVLIMLSLGIFLNICASKFLSGDLNNKYEIVPELCHYFVKLKLLTS